MIRLVFTLAFTVCALAQQSGVRAEDATALRTVAAHWVQAGHSGDAKMLAATMADDFFAKTPGGAVVGKQDLLPHDTSSDTLPELKLQDEDLRVFGETAVMMGSLVSPSGQGMALRSMMVFRKSGGEWKMIAAELTRGK